MEFFHYHIKKIEQQEDKDKRDLFLSFPRRNLFLRYNAQGKINWVFRERENVEEFNRWIEQDNVLLFSILKTIYRNENIIKFILFDLKYKYPFLQKKKKKIIEETHDKLSSIYHRSNSTRQWIDHDKFGHAIHVEIWIHSNLSEVG